MHGLDRVENFVRIVSIERFVDVGEGPVFASDGIFLVAVVAVLWFVMAIAVMAVVSAVSAMSMVSAVAMAWLVMARVATVMIAMAVGRGRIAGLAVAVTAVAVTTESVRGAESVCSVAVSMAAILVRIERLTELGVLRKLEASIGSAMCMDFAVVAVGAGARVGGLLVGRGNALLLQRKASGAKPSFE